MMTEDVSKQWRPELEGWSDDILPFYDAIARELPNPCTVVEVGSAHGRSAIFLASRLLELGHGSSTRIYMVDSWLGGWFSSCLPSIVKHATPAELELLHVVRQRSRFASRMFGRENLDMVFIDGDHSRIAVAEDLATWAHLVKRSGILAGHDFEQNEFPGVVEAVEDFAKRNHLQLELATRSVWRMR